MLYSLFSALKSATYIMIGKFDWKYLSVSRPMGDPKERQKVRGRWRG